MCIQEMTSTSDCLDKSLVYHISACGTSMRMVIRIQRIDSTDTHRFVRVGNVQAMIDETRTRGTCC